ncbi:DUF501 domain-containing protein [Galactobacter valiniphilus]|uniref:DUF501 domain-containing protein n=1 Tax=Galactobacter valiniphilus TaxID=2676122 RepID=UPI00389946DB
MPTPSVPVAEALAAAERTPSQQDLDTVSRQLGRPARDIVEIGARCVCGNPLVATTAPRLSSGIPFPTTYYLTHPVITAAVSRLEAAGEMVTMNERLETDEELQAAQLRAHEHYLAVRDAIGERSGVGPVPEIDGVSAGAMPARVKCLHVMVGHSLAAGPGVNALGDEALAKITQWWTADVCACAGAWDTEAPVPEQDRSRHVRTQAGDPEAKRRERAAKRAAREAAEAEAGSATDTQTEA